MLPADTIVIIASAARIAGDLLLLGLILVTTFAQIDCLGYDPPEAGPQPGDPAGEKKTDEPGAIRGKIRPNSYGQ